MLTHRNYILDQLYQAAPAETASHAYSLLDALQDMKPGQQVQAVGLLFLVLCSEFRLPVRDAFTVGERILKDAEAKHAEHIQAIRNYIQGELK